MLAEPAEGARESSPCRAVPSKPHGKGASVPVFSLSQESRDAESGTNWFEGAVWQPLNFELQRSASHCAGKASKHSRGGWAAQQARLSGSFPRVGGLRALSNPTVNDSGTERQLMGF